MAMTAPQIQILMRNGVEILIREFRGTYGAETVERFVEESLAELMRTATVNDFLPLLAHRFTRERLRALGQADGVLSRDRPEVLFVCTHNAGRSQMAAALTTSLSGGRVRVRSAGSTPGPEVNPVVAEAMGEIGIDLAEAFPKPLTDEVVRAADVVITMGCGDACPLYPGKRYLDWDVPDPAGKQIDAVRAIREDVRARVEALLGELELPPSAAAGRPA